MELPRIFQNTKVTVHLSEDKKISYDFEDDDSHRKYIGYYRY